MTADEIAVMNAALDKGITPERWTTKSHRSPIEVVFPDGRRVVSLYDIRSYDDWWDVKGIGRCNFGKSMICNRRTIVEYPEGRQQETTLEVQGAIEIAKDRREREKSKGLLERLARRIFG